MNLKESKKGGTYEEVSRKEIEGRHLVIIISIHILKEWKVIINT